MKCSLIDVAVGIAILTQQWFSEYWTGLKRKEAGALLTTWFVGWTVVLGSIVLYFARTMPVDPTMPLLVDVFFAAMLGFVGAFLLLVVFAIGESVWTSLKKACEVGRNSRNPQQ